MKYHLYTDGGARFNPGPAGIGVVLKTSAGKVLEKCGKFIGVKTNNEAEYLALIEGLMIAKKYKMDALICFMDSRLVVNQLNGLYKIKNARMRYLLMKVKLQENQFKKIEYRHIPREKNSEADKLANKAINENK